MNAFNMTKRVPPLFDEPHGAACSLSSLIFGDASRFLESRS